MSDRCEPPEHLRKVDGWHWVETRAIKLRFIRRWWRARGVWCWADMDDRTLASFRYLSPVATPEEVEALRADRSALEAKLTVERNYSDTLRARVETLEAENTLLRLAHEPDRSGPSFLDWVADRLVFVHNDSPNMDFVQALRRRASLARSALENKP